MNLDVIGICRASAFNMGLIGFQIHTSRNGNNLHSEAFLRGEHSMARHIARMIYRRFGPVQRREVRAEIREGWRTARIATRKTTRKH